MAAKSYAKKAFRRFIAILEIIKSRQEIDVSIFCPV